MKVHRSMRRPRPGAYFVKGAYWDGLGSGPGLPAWSFDFIGVHDSVLFRELGKAEFSLSAPMCLVNQASGERPEWECTLRFTTRKAAIRKARELGARLGVFVVDCVADPVGPGRCTVGLKSLAEVVS